MFENEAAGKANRAEDQKFEAEMNKIPETIEPEETQREADRPETNYEPDRVANTSDVKDIPERPFATSPKVGGSAHATNKQDYSGANV